MHGNEIQIEPGFFFGQMLSVLGGLFLVSVGAAILYSIAYWRLHGQAFEGELIGIRRRGAYFHSVFRYALPGGGWREATSVQGGASLKGRTMGRRLEIHVMADHPDEAHEAAAPVLWALALGLVLGGGWLTYYSVTMWKRSAVTWILFTLALLYLERKVWRRLAPYLTKMRSQPVASDPWSALPIETAESLGLSPAVNRFRVSSSKPGRAGPILCIAGLAVLGLTYIPVHKLLLLRNGTRTEGTILRLERDMSNRAGNNHPGIYPVVQFTSADDTIVRFSDRVGANPSPYKVGDHVPVLYKPGKQDTAMIDRGMRNWEVVGSMLLLGTVLTILGFVSLGGIFKMNSGSLPSASLRSHGKLG